MKNIIAILLLAAVCASAQTYVRTDHQIAATITNGATYTYAGTNTVDAQRYTEVGLELTFQGSAATTNNLVLSFLRSADGTNYESQVWDRWLVSSQGTNIVRSLTNFNLAAIGYLKLYQIVSTNANNHTNAAFYSYLKGYRRD